jgi:hypothetical protein
MQVDAHMITLTAPNGSQLHLDETGILSVRGADAADVGFRACLQLVTGEQAVAEGAASVIDRLGTTPTFLQLTRPNNTPVWINTAAILILSSAIDVKGRACIYFMRGLQGVAEEPNFIAGQLEDELPFVQLTRPNNTPVWINAAEITRMRPPTDVDIPPGTIVRAVLEVGSRRQAVQEDVATIRSIRRIVDARRDAARGRVPQEVAQPAEIHSTLEQSEHVVILVHGIRDYALWQDAIRKVLKDEVTVESTNYGRFDLFRFLVPISYFRNNAIRSVWKQIRDVKKQYPNAKYSFVAHSFGTYILAQILSQEFDFAAYRIIFCGSVVKYNFRFEQIAERFATPILNEVGARDVWPAIAESVTWGYGSAGTYGFRRPRVRDRWHPGAGHGYFLDPKFCRKYWIPFFKDGTIVEGAKNPEDPPVWLKTLSVIRLKYVLLGVALAVLIPVYLFRPASPQGSVTGDVTLGSPR